MLTKFDEERIANYKKVARINKKVLDAIMDGEDPETLQLARVSILTGKISYYPATCRKVCKE